MGNGLVIDSDGKPRQIDWHEMGCVPGTSHCHRRPIQASRRHASGRPWQSGWRTTRHRSVDLSSIEDGCHGRMPAWAIEAWAVEAGVSEAGAVEAGAIEAGAIEAGAIEAGAGDFYKVKWWFETIGNG